MQEDDRQASLDDACWIDHYRALEKPLYNVIYRWLWDAEDSHDVVQEAFLRCWRERVRIRPDGFRAFVYKTALNLAANVRRRRKLWRLVSFEGLREPSTSADASASAVFSEAEEAIEALPEAMKQALLLSEIAGLSYREIAEVTGTREGTVGSRRNRALALVRERLDGKDREDE